MRRVRAGAISPARMTRSESFASGGMSRSPNSRCRSEKIWRRMERRDYRREAPTSPADEAGPRAVRSLPGARLATRRAARQRRSRRPPVRRASSSNRARARSMARRSSTHSSALWHIFSRTRPGMYRQKAGRSPPSTFSKRRASGPAMNILNARKWIRSRRRCRSAGTSYRPLRADTGDDAVPGAGWVFNSRSVRFAQDRS